MKKLTLIVLSFCVLVTGEVFAQQIFLYELLDSTSKVNSKAILKTSSDNFQENCRGSGSSKSGLCVIDYDGIVYFGDTKNGKPNGRGIFRFEFREEFYIGEFKNGSSKGGYGTYIWNDGSYFQGLVNPYPKKSQGILFQNNINRPAIYIGEVNSKDISSRHGYGVQYFYQPGVQHELTSYPIESYATNFTENIPSGSNCVYLKEKDMKVGTCVGSTSSKDFNFKEFSTINEIFTKKIDNIVASSIKYFDEAQIITNETYQVAFGEDIIEQGKKKTVQTATVEKDITGPEIIVKDTFTTDENLTATVRGRVEDDSVIASLVIDGDQVAFTNGNFSQSLYVKEDREVIIAAIDKYGNRSNKIVLLKRGQVQAVAIKYEPLDPRKITSKINNNAVALIIGIEDYENTFTAMYAKQDAILFNDFAHKAFGVPRYNIKLLTNASAKRNDTLKIMATWLPKIIKENKTDFYLFFSGHGLASDNGKDLFLLPYDGYPELLEDSTLFRNRIFQDIAKLNPRSVTVFLDTCYSGATRSDEFLVAAKPIFIEVEEQEIPDNFTVFSASAGKETAKVLKEAEHGLFSYFLMKGLEGEADKNKDQQITNGELIAYINKNVSRQASQTPQLAGDANRILVQW